MGNSAAGEAVVLDLQLLPPEIIYRVLEQVSWQDRQSFALVSRTTAGFALNEEYWRWMGLRLAMEDLVYVPNQLPASEGTWRETFLRAYTFRERWATVRHAALPVMAPPTDELPATETFHIGVCARFRPRLSETEMARLCSNGPSLRPDQVPRTVVVPLHQRLQMIRKQHECTHEEALRLLWGGQHMDPWAEARVTESQINSEADATIVTESDAVSNVQQAEDKDGDHSRAPAGVISVSTKAAILCCPSVGLRQFRFQRVFDHFSSQAQVYAAAAHPLVVEFVNGFNCTLFCFGQTGSGKTHTMFGADANSSSTLRPTPETGLVARMCGEVVTALQQRRRAGLSCQLQMAYIEVFGEKVFDLLRDSEEVGAWHGVAARSVMDGHASVPVDSLSTVETLLREGEERKRRAATAMNEFSSRAHTLLFLHLNQTHPETQRSIRSVLCLADLGGSEQVEQSRATGERLVEAVQINMGLFALQNCILALTRRRKHIPFASSQLTSLLQAALAGQSRTMVIVTGSMEGVHALQTMNALRFGERCQRIKTSAAMTTSVSEEVIITINSTLKRLEQEIRTSETWHTEKITRQDRDGTTEVVLKTVPRGAEHLRMEYERLLETRCILLGEKKSPSHQM